MARHQHFPAIWGLVLALCLCVKPAWAMDRAAYDAAQSELASVLYDFEGNLIEKEAIEMNVKSMVPKGQSIEARYADYNQRGQQLTAYCQGTFPEPEYSRRKAQCSADIAQMDSLIRQLDIERDAFNSQLQELQARDTRRAQAAQPIQKRFETGIIHLVTACMTMTLAEQKTYCHLPAAPGPRTRPLVAEIDAMLIGQLNKPAQ